MNIEWEKVDSYIDYESTVPKSKTLWASLDNDADGIYTISSLWSLFKCNKSYINTIGNYF